MLRTAGTIYVPESLSREVFHLTVIGRSFKSYCHLILFESSKDTHFLRHFNYLCSDENLTENINNLYRYRPNRCAGDDVDGPDWRQLGRGADAGPVRSRRRLILYRKFEIVNLV